MAVYRHIIAEIELVGWNLIESLDTFHMKLQLNITSTAASLPISTTIAFPSDYPFSPPRVSAALPIPFELRWSPTCTLLSVIQQVRETSFRYEVCIRPRLCVVLLMDSDVLESDERY